MAKKKKIQIVGAGLSGMIAAINLAKDNYNVTVLEAEPRIGGAEIYHPSLHLTPINTKEVSEYISIDINDHFVMMENLHMYVEERKLDILPGCYWGVERGPRPSSLDSMLYEEAKQLGVGFEFNRRITSVDDLPPQTIIATGLDSFMYDVLGLPYKDTPAIHVCKSSTEKDKYGLGMYSKFSSEYFYGGAMNNLLYCMLPLKDPSDVDNLDAVLPLLSKCEQINIPKKEWVLAPFRIPMGSPKNLRLFYKDKILAGSISGMMDPFFYFGIHGAMISGKIAAITVIDRQKGQEEFNHVNRYYRRLFYIKKAFDLLPGGAKMTLINMMISFPYLFGPAIKMLSMGIPGHNDPAYFYRCLVGSKS